MNVRSTRLPAGLRVMCLAIAVAALFAGCAGSTTESPGVATGAAEEDSERSEPESVSPLADAVGFNYLDEDEVSAWMEDAEVEWRRFTAECMLAEGFEYSQEAWTSPAALPADLPRSSREFAITYGFGVVPAFLAATYDPTADYDPPNAGYVGSLTPAERDAYFTALHGSPEGETTRANGFPTEGCAGQAFTDAFDLIVQFDAFLPIAETYIERMEADERMVAIRDQQSECMTEAGYPGIDPDALVESFSTRLVAIFRSGDVFEYSPGDVPDLPAPDLAINGPSWRVLPKLNEKGQVKVDELLAEELATATALFDCRDATSDAMQAIEFEYESLLVTELGPQIQEIFAD